METSSQVTGHTERRKELVIIAAEVIKERGIEGTRLRDVASKAGVSVGLLQHYFGARSILIREAFEVAVVGDIEDRLESQRTSDDPWQRIVAVLMELISPAEPVKEARNWLDLCAAAAKDPNLQPTVIAVQDRWIRLIEHAVEDGTERGLFKPLLPATDIAQTINALSDGLVADLALGSSANGDLRADGLRIRAETVTKLLIGMTGPNGSAT